MNLKNSEDEDFVHTGCQWECTMLVSRQDWQVCELGTMLDLKFRNGRRCLFYDFQVSHLAQSVEEKTTRLWEAVVPQRIATGRDIEGSIFSSCA